MRPRPWGAAFRELPYGLNAVPLCLMALVAYGDYIRRLVLPVALLLKSLLKPQGGASLVVGYQVAVTLGHLKVLMAKQLADGLESFPLHGKP